MLIASNTLLITNLSSQDFSPESINELRAKLSSFGQLKYLVPFKALSRFVVVYSSTTAAITAKDNLLHYSVYFGQETELESQVDYLQVPEIEKNFLLSPPGSPPIDWIQSRESHPSRGGHYQILQDMEKLELEKSDKPLKQDELLNDSRIVLTFTNPLPSLCQSSSSLSLPMIIVDNYDGETLNHENWMGGGDLKTKKGAIFHQTRLPDYN